MAGLCGRRKASFKAGAFHLGAVPLGVPLVLTALIGPANTPSGLRPRGLQDRRLGAPVPSR